MPGFSPKNKNTNKFFTVPYVRSISESFMPVALKLNYKISLFPNMLKHCIKRDKDQLDIFFHKGTVYKIS